MVIMLLLKRRLMLMVPPGPAQGCPWQTDLLSGQTPCSVRKAVGLDVADWSFWDCFFFFFFFLPNQTLLGCAPCFSEVNFT